MSGSVYWAVVNVVLAMLMALGASYEPRLAVIFAAGWFTGRAITALVLPRLRYWEA